MKLKNGLQIEISKAKCSDAAEMIEYLNIVGGESDNLLFGKNGFAITVEEEECFIENLLNSKTSALLVGKIDDKIVCVGSLTSPHHKRISHQSDLAISVKKNYWNLGVGTHLMHSLINFAKENGQTEILHLGVRSDNHNAITLYRKMGFIEIGKYDRFFKINNEYFDEVLMNLYL